MSATIVLASASGVLAAGPVSAQPASRIAPPTARTSLLAASGAARYRLTDSVDLFLAGFDNASRAALRPAIAPFAAKKPDRLLPDMMAGALQVRHQSGDDGETLWFNPVFDAGLLVRWRWRGGAWAASDAWWVLGTQIRGEAVAPGRPLPIGSPTEPSVAQRLAIFAAVDFRTAAAADWRAPTADAGAASEAVRRARAAQVALAQMQTAAGYRQSLRDARHVLVFGGPTTSGLGANLRRALGQFGVDAQLTLRPVSAFRDAGGWTLVMQSPDAPGAAWLAGFVDPSDGAPTRLARVNLIPYSQAQAPQ